MLKIKVLTIFPDIFAGALAYSITGKAMDKGFWSLQAINIRDFARDKHKSVDDTPYGGGAGMVMRADVLGDAFEEAVKDLESYHAIYLSPKGNVFLQQMAKKFSELDNLIIICGRFEGIDQRFLDHYGISEVSIGDYVLTGGEIAAMVIIDASVRLIQGVVGDNHSLNEESFSLDENFSSLLEYPQYTKPPVWNEIGVPEVLLSGNHSLINKWRYEKSLEITEIRRPDLLKKHLENK